MLTYADVQEAKATLEVVYLLVPEMRARLQGVMRFVSDVEKKLDDEFDVRAEQLERSLRSRVKPLGHDVSVLS